MNKLFFSLLLIFIFTNDTIARQAGVEKPYTVSAINDKQFLFDYYKQTLETLKKSVSGLSAAQLAFKPSADKWSISQCLEHIVLTEKALFDFAKQGMVKAANPERRTEVKSTDEDIIKGINDRSFKAKATEDLTGIGKYDSTADALKDLQNDRKDIFDFIKKASIDDLRSHISDSPFGPIDAFQSLLFVAGHTSRHTLQIEEIKADRNFPKE